MTDSLFTPQFIAHLKLVVQQHHLLYPRIPPQGIFFEALVERAFRLTGIHPTDVVPTTANTPKEDLQIPEGRISIKTETGIGTRPDLINITKLCTTERDPWDSPTLIQRALEHLSRYDRILMLRAVRAARGTIHYQLVDIPIPLLMLMGTITVAPVGRRPIRQSLGGDVCDDGERLFHVHFDGTDGKCQIQGLLVSRCNMLLEWDYYISE
jgi:hypothetical protein